MSHSPGRGDMLRGGRSPKVSPLRGLAESLPLFQGLFAPGYCMPPLPGLRLFRPLPSRTPRDRKTHFSQLTGIRDSGTLRATMKSKPSLRATGTLSGTADMKAALIHDELSGTSMNEQV